MKQVFLFLIAGLLGCFSAQAQIPNTPPGGVPGQPTPPTPVIPRADGKILDDSTRQIYGPRTALYFLETDVFNNRKTLYLVDTSTTGFHQYSFPQRSAHRLVDLGNHGTATRPTYYEPPAQIGAQLGFNAFNPYAFTAQDVRYFDTKSPFSNIYYVQGGRGQSILDFDFNRNVNARWNLGFQLRRVTADKQYGPVPPRQNQRQQTNGWAFAVQSGYRAKNDKYSVLGHVRVFEYAVDEQGGLAAINTRTDPDSILRNRLGDAIARTPNATTRERRNVLHTYQQYVLANGFQLYHVLDVEGRFYRYRDPNYGDSVSRLAYPKSNNLTRFDTLTSETQYSLIENRAGIKGFFKGFNYRLHVRRRDYRFLNEYGRFLPSSDTLIRSDTSGRGFSVTNQRVWEQHYLRRSETFLGIWLNYYFADSTRLWAEGEYLLGKDYLLRGEYQGRWLRAGVSSVLSSPTLVQQRFASALLAWDNGFLNVSSQNAWARGSFRLGGVTLEPNVSYNLLKNYIYFDADGTPQQTAVPVNIFRAGLGVEFRKGVFSTLSEVQLTTRSGADVVRMPKVLVNSRLAFDVLFKKRLYIQTGLELHYKSGYYADAWLPLTGQFYLQNTFRTQGFVLVDAFADLRINRVRLFIKMANLAQGLFSNGYYPTPYYPGVQRTFGFGVSWVLFD